MRWFSKRITVLPSKPYRQHVLCSHSPTTVWVSQHIMQTSLSLEITMPALIIYYTMYFKRKYIDLSLFKVKTIAVGQTNTLSLYVTCDVSIRKVVLCIKCNVNTMLNTELTLLPALGFKMVSRGPPYKHALKAMTPRTFYGIWKKKAPRCSSRPHQKQSGQVSCNSSHYPRKLLEHTLK